ncbi:NUDIX hydrolase [Micromonospora costi]|uniref:NUDIX domain-containing protein n=1 Tax=Micromonospora costi TaxID=1530042 RepID=A0A3B0A4I4_9ACTN|nr:NUDIX domain-containing protein [Micromonospora costi]RKN55648.1 NUDIX domain-containing protein [Micromonospora costi]
MSGLTWTVAAVVTDDAGRVLLCRQGRGERRYALPGGRLRPAESPLPAVIRDIRAETGWDVEITDLVGLYHVGAPVPGAVPPPGRAGPLPDVLVHVFRARTRGARPAAGPTGGCRLSWHDPASLPDTLTPTTRAALADALAGRSGVLRTCVTTPAAGGAAGGGGAAVGRAPEQRAGSSPADPAASPPRRSPGDA